MHNLAKIIKFDLKLSKVILSVWLLVSIVLIVANTAALSSMFDTDIAWKTYVETVSTPVGIIFAGPGIGLNTPSFAIGPAVVGKLFVLLFAFLAFVNVIFVANNTRGVEETGQSELILSTTTGRYTTSVACQIVLIGVNIFICLSTFLTLVFCGAVVYDSAIVCFALFLFAELFAGIGAFVSQIFATKRAAKIFAILLFVGLYLVQAVAAVNGVSKNGLGNMENYAWASPTTWVFEIRPFAGVQIFPIFYLLGATLLFFACAYLIQAKRNYGSALISISFGSKKASIFLRSLSGLKIKLNRAPFVI